LEEAHARRRRHVIRREDAWRVNRAVHRGHARHHDV
jgi:hypothetical protein